ncbi:MAG: hypothetical protein IJQ31_03830 [Thermoguttaceae bacterium]|nr:hypothetical protein [Thermoguttaceae bacterium]
MKKRFAEILVLIGCAALFSLGAAGLLADSDDEFDLDPPPGIQTPQSGNDASKQDADEDEDELPPAPELETPDQEPDQEQKKEPDEMEDGNSEDDLENPQNDLNEEGGEDEDFLLIPEDVSEPETGETSVVAETTETAETAEKTEETGKISVLEKPSEAEEKDEKEVKTATAEEMAELRGKIQEILKIYHFIGLSTVENSPNDIIFFIMPYGCDAEIFLGPREANTRINAIGALCWNVPMKNTVAFTGSTETLMPGLGYGIQQYSGQLLAAMAVARVPIDYRFPAGWSKLAGDDAKKDQEKSKKNSESNVPEVPKGKKNFEIRNLVEFEQKNCLWGRDLSLTLIGLSYYLEPDAEWEANDGEKWTLERIVKNELDREMKLDESSAVNQLFGLLFAIRCRKMQLGEESLTGEYKRADVFMGRYKKFILDLQNEIGVWHPKFFAMKGVTPNHATEMLEASGHILRWLVTEVPKKELKDERIFKAVKIVTELLEYQLTYWDPGNASGKEIEGIMAALHALTIYEKRAW